MVKSEIITRTAASIRRHSMLHGMHGSQAQAMKVDYESQLSPAQVCCCNLFFRSKILLWQCYGGLNIGLEASASMMLKIASFLVCFHIQKLTTTLTNIGHGFIHFISCNQNPTQRAPCHTARPIVPSGSIRLKDFSQGRACNH